MLRTRALRDLAWIVTGKPKQALTDLAAIEKLMGKPLSSAASTSIS